MTSPAPSLSLPILAHDPGPHVAVCAYRPRSSSVIPAILRALARPGIPSGVWFLTGLDPGLAREWALKGLEVPKLLPMVGRSGRFPSTQAGILVQLGSDERADLTAALRRLDELMTPFCWKDEETTGGWDADRREPLGFREFARWTPERGNAVTVQDGPGRGGTWLLYLRLETDRARFLACTTREQERVMGARKVGAAFPDAPPDAHLQVVRPYAERLLRRGFPYRVSGREGLAFLAAARHPEHFRAALVAMLEGDRLLRYTEAVSGGLYFVPGERGAGSP